MNSEIVETSSQSKNVILMCVLTFVFCFMIYKFLLNRTIEVEKFSNQPVIYSSNGKNIIE